MFDLTYASLPQWKHIIKLLFIKNVSDTEIAQPWLKNNENFYWFSKSAWSLLAIIKFRQKVTGRENVSVWIPGYFCNASIAPLRELGVDLSFYPITSNGFPDVDTCLGMAKFNRPDIIVVVHYFGGPTPLNLVSKLAKDNSAWLVEDSAHVLQPTKGIGEYGDFVIYSPHKFLPIPDGAILIVRLNVSDNNYNEYLSQHGFDEICRSIESIKSTNQRYIIFWFFKRIFQKIGLRSKISTETLFSNDEVITNSDYFINPKMSLAAKKMLLMLLDSLEGEVGTRKKNRQYWCDKIAVLQGNQKYITAVSCKNTPYLAGFSCTNNSEAVELFQLLVRSNIPVSTWPDLPPEVLNEPTKHKVAITMRNTRVFLPVHRTVTYSKIRSQILK
jgi:dTDP-4-amino-4,6-dideoxygalactose transaminase